MFFRMPGFHIIAGRILVYDRCVARDRRVSFHIQLFRERLSEKQKKKKKSAREKTERWSGYTLEF